MEAVLRAGKPPAPTKAEQEFEAVARATRLSPDQLREIAEEIDRDRSLS